MATTEKSGRPNQKNRTRKDLLLAASRLMKKGRKPSFEEVAEEALVSRATAYRYFSNVEALLVEAPLDVAIPEANELFGGRRVSIDPVTRLEQVDTVLHDMIIDNETGVRMMLANSLQHGAGDEAGDELPIRQNRRTPLIEAALEPARDQFKPAAFENLCKSLAMIIGTEGWVAAKDVLRLDDADTRKVKRWAIRSLVEAAKKSK